MFRCYIVDSHCLLVAHKNHKETGNTNRSPLFKVTALRKQESCRSSTCALVAHEVGFMADGEEATIAGYYEAHYFAIKIRSSVPFSSFANSTNDSAGRAFRTHLLCCCGASTVKCSPCRRPERDLSSLQRRGKSR